MYPSLQYLADSGTWTRNGGGDQNTRGRRTTSLCRFEARGSSKAALNVGPSTLFFAGVKSHTESHPITSTCAACGAPFIPEPRAAGRQRFCAQPACRAASRRRSQRNWRKNADNADYHSGSENVERVQTWRKANPDYCRRQRRRKGPGTGDPCDSLVAALERFALRDSCAALQNAWDPQVVALVGLLAWLRGGALQNTIAQDLTALMLHGHAILDATGFHPASAATVPANDAGSKRV